MPEDKEPIDSESDERRDAMSSDGPTEADPAEAAADAVTDDDADESESDAADADEVSGADDDTDDEPVAAAASSAGASPRAGESTPKKGMTAGQRLAAAKAAKAAKKAEVRGKTPVVPTVYTKRAESAGEWIRAHGKNLAIGFIAAVVICGGAIGWWTMRQNAAAAAADALTKATEIANAPVRDEDAAALGAEEPKLSFPTAEARAKKALESFRAVVQNHAGTPPAVWAQLGVASSLFDLKKYGEARQAYETALTAAHDDSTATWRAIEGIAFSFEAEQKWADALRRFQELSHLENGAYRDIAEYHVARMYLAQNDKVRAKETLRALVDRMRGANSEEEPKNPFVFVQAEMRLAELDSSLVPRGSAGRGGGPVQVGGPGGGGMSQEELQRLIQQIQSKAGNKAPPAP